jgi:hypothetical protein
MSVKRLTVLVVLVLIAATPKVEKKAAKPEPSKVPEKLLPFIELAKLCGEYEKQVTVIQWREVWKQTYDASTTEKWQPKAPVVPEDETPAAKAKRLARTQIPTVTAESIDGRDCAVLDATDLQNAYLQVGSGPVRGEFAIEFVGKALSQRVCDLSIACTQGAQQGPAFQFGAHWNTQSFLRIVNPDGNAQPKPAPQAGKIEADRWYTVRLEVRNGKATASLDGREVASSPMKIDEKAWLPNIYIYQSKVAVDEAKVETMAPAASEIEPAVAYAKVFGARPREQVMAQIAQLVEALDDTDSRVREAAYMMLKPMGTLTRDALQGAIDTGSAEQAGRAQQLMDALPNHAKRPVP